jgi:hypothetical protein
MLMRTSQVLQQLQQTKQQQTMTAKATPTLPFRKTSRLCLLAVLSLAGLANLPATAAAGRGLREKGTNYVPTTTTTTITANRVLATMHNLQKREIVMPTPMKDIESIITLELSLPHIDEDVYKMSPKGRKLDGKGKGKGKGKGEGKGKGVRGSKNQAYDDDYVESHEKYYELGYEENCEEESHTKKSKGHNRKRKCKPKDCK